ncbi:lytic transglycosylase [Aliagarivorans marinus]|uniref:lytic transglycosylase n=1 Tax=Aliagarivorans marinus TaxID=561965 RepID=UPI00041BF037|nr:LysM peptidoglycan-binding domain-containing protein [Aliagarivorans marinus]
MRKLYVGAMCVALSACQLTARQDEPDTLEQAQAELSSNTESAAGSLELAAAPEQLPAEAELNQAALEQVEPEQPEPLTPQQVDDLWERIDMQLSLEVPLEQKSLQSQLNWYLRHPDYMRRVSQRAEPYLYFIIDEIEKRDMPLELALLPIVESAFQPFAYSHGRAAGLWQIIPGTGRRFGLEQNWWYDGRRDVYASTIAALDYLEYLNRFFDGDWTHAIAAYNSGEGRVRNAIRANKRANKPTDFWSLSLPRETSAYLPKLLALSHILQNREDYDMEIPQLANQPYFERVDVGSQIDLAVAADLAGIELEELHRLNPGFNRWATAPEGPHFLLLPIEQAERFEVAVNNMPKQDRLQWTRYTVVSGDSLSTIASRYNTTSGQIRQLNSLSGDTIRIGQALLIPISSRDSEAYTLSQEQRLAATQGRNRGAIKLNYTVKSGDSLWEIGRRYKVSHRQIASWNGMAPGDTLRLGQKLVIWQQTDVPRDQLQTITYRVRSGDSLSTIAARFKVRISDLVKWNKLDQNSYLQPGQRLKLYINVAEVSA